VRQLGSRWLIVPLLAEIVVHAVCASLAVGWASGFHFYIIVLGVSVGVLNASWMRVAGGALSVAAWLFAYNVSVSHPPWTAVSETATHALYVVNFLSAFGLSALFGYALTRAADKAEAKLSAEHKRSEALLHNILPPPIAERLKGSTEVIADGFDEASVLFSDIVGFTVLSSRVTPAELVRMLNDVFSRIDDLVHRYGLEKIKTIGDAYMVASGLPEPRADHVQVLADFALDMVDVLAELEARSGATLQMRIGIHTGPVVAGVIGKRKFAYDLWGDTVNTAARMESHGEPGRIQVSADVAARLDADFELIERGAITVKGKGEMRTFFLVGRRRENAPEPRAS